MQAKVKTNDILSALAKIKQVAKAVKGNLIFSNVHIEAQETNLTLTAMNEVAKAIVTVNAEVKEPEKFLVEASKLYDILNTFKEEVTLEYDEAKRVLNIKKDKAISQLPTVKVEAFPITSFKPKEIDTSFMLPCEALKDGFNKASAFVSDTTSGILSGVNLDLSLDKVEFLGTDGNCAIEISKEIKNEIQLNITLSKQAVNNLTPFLADAKNVKVLISGNLCIFETNDNTYLTRILEGTFPKIKHFIPKECKNVFSATKTELKTILDRIKVSETPEDKSRVHLNAQGCLLNISSPHGKVEDVVAIEKTQGEDILFTLNRNYLGTALSLLNNDSVTFGLNSSTSAVLFKENDTRMVIMPMS